MNWYLDAWKKFAVFQGRSRRKEYWFFALGNFIVVVVLSVVDGMTGTSFGVDSGYGLLSGLFCLAIVIPSIAVAVRRLHDVGRSGWWVLLGMVPLLGLVLLYFALLDSQPGDNEYGPNPKGAGASAPAPVAPA